MTLNSVSTKTWRVLARQSRTIFTLASISTLAFVTLLYLSQDGTDAFLPESWDYELPQQWDWKKLAKEWRASTVSDVPMEDDPFEIEESAHVWDNTCHEAVDKELKVAVYDWTPFHEEVVGSILASLNDTGVQTDMYRRALRYSFTDILETFYPTRDPKSFRYQHELMPKLREGDYDALIMTSCDERWIQPELLEILPTLTNMSVICLHHEMWSFNAHRSRLLNVAKADKLTFLTLGAHVKVLVKEENTGPWTADGEDGALQWTNVPTEVFVPIFPLPESIVLPSRATKRITPNDVAVLGDVDDWGRRDYPKLWANLMQAIQEDPGAWGYTISPENGHFIPSLEATDVQPFRVHLFGARKEGTVIPEELLEHVLVFYSGLDYIDYYRELSKLDLVLPILGSDEYTRNRATAAFPAGVISRVPALVKPSQLKAYSYLEPPAIVLHPEGTHEVEVLAAMRRGQDPWTSVNAPESNPVLSPMSRYSHSGLLDEHLRRRPDSHHGREDWDSYVADV
ncbi:hypothetical protein NliqN6_5287, partial [Naganishia liquefaciens]